MLVSVIPVCPARGCPRVDDRPEVVVVSSHMISPVSALSLVAVSGATVLPVEPVVRSEWTIDPAPLNPALVVVWAA